MKHPPIIKVCGMRDAENILDLLQLNPDFIGFIFHSSSPRFCGISPTDLPAFSSYKNTRRVGVFVNEKMDRIREISQKFRLDYVQLHGEEDASFCKLVRNEGLKIIKAFRVTEDFDFGTMIPFLTSCHLFLFDTASKNYGGSGKKFNWNILKNYTHAVPFLLSGGIGPGDEKLLRQFDHPSLAGFDLNSRFEISPGLKDISLLNLFINNIKSSGE